jgi:hypothetical protein
MSLVLDAGALLAVERGDRDVVALVKRERLGGRAPVTHGGIVGQVWRGGGGRQAMLARFLGGVEVRPLDDDLGRRVGMLLAATRTRDVIDAAVVLLAADGDEILTSDVDELCVLAVAARRHVDLVGI